MRLQWPENTYVEHQLIILAIAILVFGHSDERGDD